MFISRLARVVIPGVPRHIHHVSAKTWFLSLGEWFMGDED